MQLDVTGKSENFLVDTRSLLRLFRRLLLPNLYYFGCCRKSSYKNIHLSTSLLGGQIFSHQLLLVPECPTPLLGRDLSLSSKSCSYCSPDRRCFKTLFWEQTIFTSHQEKELLKGRGHLCMSYQRILRYQVVRMENPGLTILPCDVLNPATLLPTPEGSLPFHSCLETLDHWTKL